jgi:hypothetical protein
MSTEAAKRKLLDKGEQSVPRGKKSDHRLVGGGLGDSTIGHLEIGISCNYYFGSIPLQ